MVDLRGKLTATQRVVLAIDTSDLSRARELTSLAHNAGASLIKVGLELASAPGSSWELASQIAAKARLDWIADTKGDDISATIVGLIRNLVRLEHPPVAITMQIHAGVDSMHSAQEIAGERGIIILGVTELTSIKEEELRRQFGFVLARLEMGELPKGMQDQPDEPTVRKAMVHMRATEAHLAGINGLVASAKELIDPIKSDSDLASMFTLIPGTRSSGVNANDQGNVETPEFATANGADLLVIGREVTASKDPAKSLQNVVMGIQRGLEKRPSANH